MSACKKKTRPIGFGMVFSGLLLFFNPYFAVVDILPDFIGCLLVYFGLTRISTLYRGMAEARLAFLKLFGVYLAKDIAVIVVFGMSTNAERPVGLLLVGFAAAVVGLYFAFSAFRALFDGFYGLAVTRDCPALYGKYKQRRWLWQEGIERSRTEIALRASLIFLVVREVICLLPEFSALTTSTYLDSDLIRLYDYIGAMRVLACVFVLIAGLIWACYLCRYFITLARQHEFRQTLGVQAAEYASEHPGDAIVRRYGLCFLLLLLGAVFTTDFYLDFKNMIPDVVAALLFLGGILLTDLTRPQKLLAAISALGYGAIAVFSTRFAYSFSVNYSGGEISKTAEAANAHLLLWVVALAEFLIFLVFLAALLLLLRRVIAKWAGYLPTHDDLEFEKRRRDAFIEEFDRDLIRTFIFGFVSALCSFIYDYVKEIPSSGIFRLMEFFWAVDFAMALIFAVMMGVLLSNIHKEIKYRFTYES